MIFRILSSIYIKIIFMICDSKIIKREFYISIKFFFLL